jgi:hypothetical protein
MPQKTLASQASIFDESLHVPDYHVINLLIENANEIPGFAFLLRYAKFILEKSAGHINRYQWHSRDTICEAMQIQKPHLARYESKWLEAGWLSKIESKGRIPSKRLLGPKFDGVREACCASSNRYQDGTSNRYQPGTSNRYQPGTTNPNNINLNDLNLNSHTQRACANNLAESKCRIEEVFDLSDFELLDDLATRIAKRLLNEHNVVSNRELLRHYLALAQQSNPREKAFYDDHETEMILYVVAQRNPTKDPALTVFNWLKNHRDFRQKKKLPKQVGQVKTLSDTELREKFYGKPAEAVLDEELKQRLEEMGDVDEWFV